MDNSRKKAVICISAVGALSVLTLGAGFGLAEYIMKSKRLTLDEEMLWQREHYDTSFYGKLEKTDYTVMGAEGYELNVQFIRNPVPTDKYVIITHGYTGNRLGALKYVRFYLELGFNCVIYDLRGHGLNRRTFTTFSVLEGRDLAAVIRDTRQRYKNISKLGLHGESLGAASTVSCLQYKPEVDFAVADCGFADIENVLRGGFRSSHLPGSVYHIANMGARLRYGYSFGDMRPIDRLSENRVPILFIHGGKDTIILPENSKAMAERTGGYSELFIAEDADHAASVLVDVEAYKDRVEKFLRKTGVI